MAIKDLHLLPRVEDGWSFLYAEHSRIEQDGKSISVWEDTGRTAVPCAALSLLMLGPGTAITHAAVRTLAESGCMILWCGEEGVRVYGVGLGETRSSRNLLSQAKAWADPRTRLTVVRRMYARMMLPAALHRFMIARRYLATGLSGYSQDTTLGFHDAVGTTQPHSPGRGGPSRRSPGAGEGPHLRRSVGAVHPGRRCRSPGSRRRAQPAQAGDASVHRRADALRRRCFGSRGEARCSSACGARRRPGYLRLPRRNAGPPAHL